MKKFLLRGLTALALAALVTLPAGRANAQSLFVANYKNNTVGEYDAVTGASLNPTFISPSTGFYYPSGVSVLNNTLYVASYQTVTAYNATTGAPATGFNTIQPSNGAGLGALASGTLLYVSTFSNGLNGGTVTAYDALTGLQAPFFAPISDGDQPLGLAILGTTLYVSYGGGSVSTYNALTGQLINANFLTGISNSYFMLISGSTIYVSSFDLGKVYAFNAVTGAPLPGFTTINDPNQPRGLAVVGNDLLVANSSSTNTVSEYDAASGALVTANFISGLHTPFGLAVTVPEPSTWAMLGLGGVGAGVMALRQRRQVGV